ARVSLARGDAGAEARAQSRVGGDTELARDHKEVWPRRHRDTEDGPRATRRRAIGERGVRPAGLRSRPAGAAESDRRNERPALFMAFIPAIRSAARVAYATPVERLTSVSLCLCV